VWHEWASQSDLCRVIPKDAPVLRGDVVIFDHLLVPVSFDHMGIVLDGTDTDLLTAEGNVENQAGIFLRPRDTRVNCFIRFRDF